MAMSFVDCLTLGRQGDRSAQEVLFGRWRPLLRLQARNLLGAELCARVDPSDIVQETVQQAFQDLNQFRGTTEGEWVGWLQKLVAGHAAKARRHHLADKRDLQRESAYPASHLVDPRTGQPEKVLDREQAVRLAAVIEQLPPDMRQIILRRVFDRVPFAVLAGELGRSPGALRVMWTRALHRLRELLETRP
jgi:RNA polymerase sigma-70 factor (ECF subfamily)